MAWAAGVAVALALLAPSAAAAGPSVACKAPASESAADIAAVCADFCSGGCSWLNSSAGETGAATTLTQYRMTPRNCTTLTNKDTGDARGDLTFVFSQRSWHSDFLANITTNVIAKFEVDVDGGWGPYKQCNPMYGWDTSHFACEFGCMSPPHCSVQSTTGNGTGFGGIFCGCERANLTVGRVNMGSTHWSHHGGGILPSDKCGYSFETLDHHCLNGTRLATVTGANVSDTLGNLCGACGDDDKCQGWTTFDNLTGYTFGDTAEVNRSDVKGGCVSATKRAGHHKWLSVGGEWYSNTAEGECAKDASPGDASGCTWKLRTIAKYANETCVLDRVNAAVERYGAKCFGACPGARNTSSPCYGDCYTRTVSGDWYEHVDPMPVPLLVAAWETAFTSDDPATGGCEREELPYACGNEGPPPPSPSASAGTNSSPSS